MKVFLLDDNPDDRELIKHRLRKQFGELEFVEAGDPAAFQTVLEQGGFDAVVTDYLLRWSDGLEVLRQLKEKYPNVPVVMVTGSGNEEVAVEGLRSGLSDYVLKQHLERLPYSLRDILERQRLREKRDEAVEQLRQSEARYRLISELISDFAYSLRMESNGSITSQWATEALVRLTGYTPQEFRRADEMINLVHPDDQAVVFAHFQQALNSENAVAEFRIIHKDGSPRWLRNYVRPVPGEGGAIIQIYGAAQDITARKEAAERDQRLQAEALRDTAAALTSTLNLHDLLEEILANVGRVVPHEAANIMLIDSSGPGEPIARVVGVRGYERFGLAQDWIQTSRWPLKQFFTLREMAHTQQPLVISDTRHSSVWASVSELDWVHSWVGAPLCLRGEVMGFITLTSATPGFFHPQAAERLRAFADQAALAIHNARLYDSVQQQAAELSSLYRAAGPLLGASTDSAQLAQQIVDTVASEFSFAQCGIAFVDDHHQKLMLVAQRGDIGLLVGNDLPLDGPGLCPAAARTGEIIYVPDVAADPRYLTGNAATQSELVIPLSVGGRVLGVIDLQSARREAFAERDRRILTAYAEHAALALQNAQLLTHLTQARQTAEEANRAKTEFLANTSHELRTPLTGIIGALDIVLGGLCDSPQEERHFIGVAQNASRHLLGLINNLLDVAKIEAGRLELDWQEIDVSLAMAEAINLVQPQMEAKAIRLDVHLPEPPAPPVWGDHGRVRQILLNLFDNAIKFTERGQITLRAVVLEPAAPAGARQMQITFQDTGIGIPVEEQAKLFQPFAQADGSSTRKYGGTGLGLSISRRLAELMGGALTLYSAGENQGTTCTLLLPLAPPPDSA